jgi:Tfp pilus assembly protein PilX
MWLRNRWRPLLVVVAAAALCMSLLALVLHQRRLSDRLRQTIDAMQEAARALPLREATPAQSSNEDRASPRTGSRSRSTDLQSTDREQLELKAATFVIANDYRAALDSYLRLAAGSPDEPVFSDLVTILRAKLACRAKHGLDGPPCD